MSSKKSNLKQWMWAVLACMALWLACITGAAAEEVLDMDAAVLNDTSGALLPEAPGISMFSSRGASSGFSYGSQLSGNELKMYEALAAISNMREYSYADSTGVTISLQEAYICEGDKDTYQSSEGFAQLRKDYNRATHAYIKDFGNEYWISSFNIGWSYRTGGDSITISSLTFYPTDYYDGIREELGITDEALNAAIHAVSSAAGRYDKVKAAHDYVAKLVDYNYNDMSAAYGHTITGGLLDKYNHLGVCECYAKLFRLLCDANGIPCILVTGGSTRDGSGNVVSDHMWNYVQMGDGQWYVVDVTWDDQTSGIRYEYFLAGSQSDGFNGNKVGEDHLPVGVFSASVPYDPFVMPSMAQTSYEKETEIPVTKILLNHGEITVEEDSQETIELSVVNVEPEDANAGLDVLWESSDPEVAEVDSEGTVTVKKAGESVITVSSREYPSVKAECTITVRAHVFDDGEITREPDCLEEGQKLYTCTNNGCEKTKEEVLPALEHSPEEEWTVTQEATCTESGKQQKKCIRCEEVLEEEVIPAKEHAYGEWEIIEEATCTEEGSKKRTCANCQDVQTEDIAALAHTPGEWTVTKEASCTEQGSRERRCTVCSAVTDSETTAALEHSYGEWTVTEESTCTEKGSKKRTCANCQDVQTEDIAALGHTPGEWTVTQEASCTEQGSKERRCTVCSAVTDSETIGAQGHSYGEWTVTQEPTCTEKGSKKHTCANCQDVQMEDIAALGHTPGAWTVTKAATCTAAGTQEQSCTVCGIMTDSKTINALGHSYGSWTVTKAATCTAEGSQQRVCIRCGNDVQTQLIEKKNHTQGAWTVTKAATCTAAGTQEQRCTVCRTLLGSKAVPAAGHKAGAWTVTKAATPVSEGEEQQKCTVCGSVINTRKVAKVKAKVTLNAASIPLQVKKSTSALKIKSYTAGDSVLEWTSSNEKVAAVNKKTGKITAKKTGTAKITVTMKSGAKAVCTVKVQKKAVKTSKIVLSKKAAVLKKGQSYTVTVVRTPITTLEKIKYTSSNKKVATVNSKGKITAKKKGKATITVKSGSKKAVIKITVK